jgi:hypothetical protein
MRTALCATLWEAAMRSLEASPWTPSLLAFEHVSGIGYRVERARSGLYDAFIRECPGGCWGCFAEGFESVFEAVQACEAEHASRMGGAL